MRLSIYIVDAFTDQPFAGNPAGVCLMPSPRDAHWMQDIASEMNLSETAFVVEQDGGFRLQWFTPAVEVDLCGHATLAAAHVLWEQKVLAQGETARFNTRSGILTAARKSGWIEMNFPAEPAEVMAKPAGIAAALGVAEDQVRWTGRSRVDLFVELESEEVLRTLKPDLTKLAKVETARGIIVTAKSGAPNCDFVSRFFSPKVGVIEDPVSGSVHCALGPYWGQKLGKTEMTGYQASKRGGWVKVALAADRVLLQGKAVTVIRGEIDQ